jgi:aspartyl-tRNA(Asn)/glutamyl-tRNA(Gln) amidotransferase subunit B
MKHHDSYEPVIGLEIHAQLNTKTKLFSSDKNHFGDDPNTNISPLSVGLPGALPVLNKESVRKAMQFCLAVDAAVQPWSRFDRKSYFYPDCPRNYQITQFDHPIGLGGTVIALVDGKEKSFSITKIQLEDDAGMLKHFSSFAGVDFNRSGVPLIEIVSDPCMHSPKEASAYASAIRGILDYLDASTCNMEEGALRFDVNVSVRKKGEKGLRNRVEIKNMNSFSNLEQAVEHEIDRQISLYEQHPHQDPSEVVTQVTYRWDLETNSTVLMRTKEDAEDYRYFPEPDLLPLIVSLDEIEALRQALPELPLQKERRYVREYDLSAQLAYFFSSDRRLALYFEEALLTKANPKTIANWIAVEFTGRLKEIGSCIYKSGISPSHVGDLVLLIEQGKVTGKIAKSVADEMVAHPCLSPLVIIDENPAFKPFSDFEQLSLIISQVIANNRQSVLDFKAGKERAFGFLVGQVMKQTKGSAVPEEVNRLLKEAIEQYT